MHVCLQACARVIPGKLTQQKHRGLVVYNDHRFFQGSSHSRNIEGWCSTYNGHTGWRRIEQPVFMCVCLHACARVIPGQLTQQKHRGLLVYNGHRFFQGSSHSKNIEVWCSTYNDHTGWKRIKQPVCMCACVFAGMRTGYSRPAHKAET